MLLIKVFQWIWEVREFLLQIYIQCYHMYFVPLLFLLQYHFIVSASGRSPLSNIHHRKWRRKGGRIVLHMECYIYTGLIYLVWPNRSSATYCVLHTHGPDLSWHPLLTPHYLCQGKDGPCIDTIVQPSPPIAIIMAYLVMIWGRIWASGTPSSGRRTASHQGPAWLCAPGPA